LDLQNWIAVHQPVDPLVDFVHRPLYTAGTVALIDREARACQLRRDSLFR